MLDPNYFDAIAANIPFIRDPNMELAKEFQRAAYHVRIPAGRELFHEGDHVGGIALLISGQVRVYKIGETGREITLYRFGAGESCVFTANAILNAENFPAIAVVEEVAEAVMVPAAIFGDWVRRYDPWRSFVFGLVAHRLAAVMEIVEEVAFQRMDRRISALLLQRARQANPIQITHQSIANELGSSREVISRLLAEMSAAGNIRLSRGEIEVLKPAVLEELLTL